MHRCTRLIRRVSVTILKKVIRFFVFFWFSPSILDPYACAFENNINSQIMLKFRGHTVNNMLTTM